jgi:DNA-binding CsgD family transcriptional regulator
MTQFKSTRPIRPDDLEIIDQIPGIVGVVRNAEFELVWSTHSFLRLLKTNESLMGTTLRDIFGETAAIEREELQTKVVKTQQSVSHLQFSSDLRFLCTVFPLDAAAFGHNGVLAVIRDAPIDFELSDPEILVLSTPELRELKALTTRELEILYFISQGLSTIDIAEKLFRSQKTIENQVNAIHTKLNTHSRAQLVLFTAERGIQSFTLEQWNNIVLGAKVARKEAKQAAK